MIQRFDAMFAKESNGKTYWNRCGVAFVNKAGNGYNVILDCIPAPVDGAFKFSLFEPKDNSSNDRPPVNNERSSGSSNSSGYSARPGSNRGNFDSGDADDSIPF